MLSSISNNNIIIIIVTITEPTLFLWPLFESSGVQRGEMLEDQV